MPPYQAGLENCCTLDSLFLLRLNDLLFIWGTSTIGTCCTLHMPLPIVPARYLTQTAISTALRPRAVMTRPAQFLC